jgi:hypothetical protein
MTWVLVLFGMCVTTFCIIIPWMGLGSTTAWLNIIAYNVIAMLGMYSHIAAMTTDPGAVPKAAKPLPEEDADQDPEMNGR